MDRRFTAWLLISCCLLFLWTNYQSRQEALRKEAEEQAAKKVAPVDPSIVAAQAPQKTTSYHNLGTMNPNSGFKLLVTCTSKGAGIARVELVEQTKNGTFRYAALEGVASYIGFLGLTPSDKGLTVGCVPIGSPAADAEGPDTKGLQVGDKITDIDGVATTTDEEWFQAFKKKKPDEEVKIGVERNGSTLIFKAMTIHPPLDAVHMVDDRLTEEVAFNLIRESCLTTLSQIDNLRISAGEAAIQGLASTLEGNWNSKPIDEPGISGIEYTMPIQMEAAGKPIQLELVKRYRIRNDAEAGKEWNGYTIDMQTLCRNTDKVAHNVGFRQETFNGVTLEGWWYLSKIGPNFLGGAGSRDVVYSSKYAGHQMVTRPSIYSAAMSNKTVPELVFINPSDTADKRQISYLGIDAQFFAAAMLPSSADPGSMSDIQTAAAVCYSDMKKAETDRSRQQASNVGAWFETTPRILEPGQELEKRYTLFVGPKHPDALSAFGMDRLLGYGWFGFVAKPLTYILHAFHRVSFNYGIAIIMLTILVRSCMFPISRRAALNAQKMQELAPEMKRISELYKDDLTKRTQATQELYKKHNFKPLAGCIPVFFQIPIFIGLYRAVSVDIELRQQGLVPGWHWCSNLAGPDMMLDWSTWMPQFIAGKGVGWFGPYLNLLPIITVTLFIVQQKVLMPKATDEQQQMTQTMMMWMTVFMGVLFFKVPAGLCIYFITSSIWSLVERNLVKRLVPPPTPGSAVAVGGGGGGSSMVVEGTARPVSQPNQLPEKAKPKATKAQQRPEKLSDIIPWFKRFEKDSEEAPPAKEPPTTSSRPAPKRKNPDRKKRK